MFKPRFIFLYVGLTACIIYAVCVYAIKPLGFQKQYFRINNGESVSKIADQLASKNLIWSKTVFLFQTYITNSTENIKAGEYYFNESLSVGLTLNKLTKGIGSSTNLISIPEGSNIQDIDQILTKAGLIRRGAFLGGHLSMYEGYFFPDSYDFGPSPSINDISTKMIETFYAKLLQRSPPKNIKLIVSYRGPLDITPAERNRVIIASILEKEVRKQEDMRIVSGIIQNRLKYPMRLQIDATAIYGFCSTYFKSGVECNLPVSNISSVIEKSNSYNTYTIDGLPIGPISNPGYQAYSAASRPAQTDYFYYFTSRDGLMVYSRTFSEHTTRLKGP